MAMMFKAGIVPCSTCNLWYTYILVVWTLDIAQITDDIKPLLLSTLHLKGIPILSLFWAHMVYPVLRDCGYYYRRATRHPVDMGPPPEAITVSCKSFNLSCTLCCPVTRSSTWLLKQNWIGFYFFLKKFVFLFSLLE